MMQSATVSASSSVNQIFRLRASGKCIRIDGLPSNGQGSRVMITLPLCTLGIKHILCVRASLFFFRLRISILRAGRPTVFVVDPPLLIVLFAATEDKRARKDIAGIFLVGIMHAVLAEPLHEYHALGAVARAIALACFFSVLYRHHFSPFVARRAISSAVLGSNFQPSAFCKAVTARRCASGASLFSCVATTHCASLST